MRSFQATLVVAGLLGGIVLGTFGCTALLGAGYTEAAGDGGATPNDATVADANTDTGPSGGDACSTTPTTKAGFESNVCNGGVCAPGDNSAVLDSGLCTLDAGVIVCTLPVYSAPDAAASSSPSGVDAGADTGDDGGAAQDASAPPVDSGPLPPTLTPCRSIPGSSPIASNPSFAYPSQVAYAIGSTAIQPYVGSIAQQYAAGVSAGDAGTFSATIIYAGTGSCVGVEAAYVPSGQKETMVTAMNNQKVAKVASGSSQVYTANYYDPTPPAPGAFPTLYTCSIDPNDPEDQALLADMGFSDVFPASCASLPYPAPTDPLPNAEFADLYGPVQIMEMVVGTNSSAQSITYEQAELVWGYGGAAGIAPWTDSSFLFKRSPSSGTQTMIGAAIGLDPRVWQGVANQGSPNVVTDLENSINTGLPDGGAGDPKTAVDLAMGILSSDYTDENASTLRPLAFQDRGESCAWLPDSSGSTYDKRNVRDGHYPVWGPSHLIAPVAGGLPSNPITSRVYEALNGQDPALARTLDVIKLYATHHIVPTCAMHVSRTSDGQGYASYQPPGRTACSCYYDSVVPLDKPDSTCTPCQTDADCADPTRTCNIFSGTSGFCEVLGAP